jgi:hypothetical protein
VRPLKRFLRLVKEPETDTIWVLRAASLLRQEPYCEARAELRVLALLIELVIVGKAALRATTFVLAVLAVAVIVVRMVPWMTMVEVAVETRLDMVTDWVLAKVACAARLVDAVVDWAASVLLDESRDAAVVVDCEATAADTVVIALAVAVSMLAMVESSVLWEL